MSWGGSSQASASAGGTIGITDFALRAGTAAGQDNVRLYVRQTYAYPSELISRVSGSVYVHGSIMASLPVSGGF